MNNKYFERGITNTIKKMSANFPVLILEGARAVGKSTLLKNIAKESTYTYVSLGDIQELQIAKSDILQFVNSLETPAIIDEAQLIEELPLVIKAKIDEDPKKRYILSGSARVGKGALGGTDPLAGRVIRKKLFPFVQSEILGSPKKDLISSLFNNEYLENKTYETTDRTKIVEMFKHPRTPILHFNEHITTNISSYVDTVLDNLYLPPNINSGKMKNIFKYICSYSPGLLNVSKMSQESGIARNTLNSYLQYFKNAFLIEEIPNYASSQLFSMSSTNKFLALDPYFSLWANNIDSNNISKNPLFGLLTEGLILQELITLIEWEDEPYSKYFWRQNTNEVDFIVMNENGEAVAVEIKSSTIFDEKNSKGIIAFSKKNNSYLKGYVLYGGSKVVKDKFGVIHLPISFLWC